MYEPFVFQVVKEILGPLYKREHSNSHRQVRFASQIEEIHEIIKDSVDIQEVCDDATLKYVDRIVDCLFVNVRNPLELSQVEEFANGVLSSAFKKSQEKIIQQYLVRVEAKKKFGEDMSKKLLDDAIKFTCEEQRRLSMIERFCEEFITLHIQPTVECFDVVKDYATKKSKDILRTSVNEAVAHNTHVKNVTQYSEDLSKLVLGDSLKDLRLSYTTDPCTQNAVIVAEKIIRNLFCESCYQQSVSKPPDLRFQRFSENLCSNVWNEVYDDSSLRSSILHGDEREYMSLTLHKCDETNNEDQNKSKNSNSDSSNSSFLTVNRRDSCDTSSEALTPKSAIDESTWKKGLYQFADQLLYSLSHLAEEPRIPDMFVPADIGALSSKVRRSGSCPHILRIPSTVYETPCTRRQSETLIRFSGGMNGFAESLASDIMLSSFLEF